MVPKLVYPLWLEKTSFSPGAKGRDVATRDPGGPSSLSGPASAREFAGQTHGTVNTNAFLQSLGPQKSWRYHLSTGKLFIFTKWIQWLFKGVRESKCVKTPMQLLVVDAECVIRWPRRKTLKLRLSHSHLKTSDGLGVPRKWKLTRGHLSQKQQH